MTKSKKSAKSTKSAKSSVVFPVVENVTESPAEATPKVVVQKAVPKTILEAAGTNEKFLKIEKIFRDGVSRQRGQIMKDAGTPLCYRNWLDRLVEFGLMTKTGGKGTGARTIWTPVPLTTPKVKKTKKPAKS